MTDNFPTDMLSTETQPQQARRPPSCIEVCQRSIKTANLRAK